MFTINRSELASALLVALALTACAAGPDASEAAPSASPSASIAPSPSTPAAVRPLRDTGPNGILAPGTFVLDEFPVALTFEIPEGDGPGWHVGKSTAGAAILLWYTPPEFTYLLAWWNVDNLYVDPCDAAAGRLDPPIGPSIDDLVTALSAQPEFDATPAVDVTVGSFSGKRIELTALDSGDGCPAAIPFSAGATNTDMAPGETLELNILDVDGVRLVLVVLDDPEQPDSAGASQLVQILESTRVEP
jgi:hypothetical protein